MPDIGATLREARMRQHLDISEIEAQTKIRAKYLRALENEEWDVLPGPTFVRTFLRTYAQTLGLDARLLLEEYKLRFERPSEQELVPISPQTPRERARAARRGGRSGIGRDVLVAVFVVALIGILILLGRGGGDGSDADKVPPSSRASQGPATTATTERTTTTTAKKAPATVALRLAPSDTSVWVCVRDAAGNTTRVVGNVGPSTTLHTYHSTRFRVTIGNGSMNLRVDGKFFDVPESQQPLAYEFTAEGHRRLYGAAQPTCGA